VIDKPFFPCRFNIRTSDCTLVQLPPSSAVQLYPISKDIEKNSLHLLYLKTQFVPHSKHTPSWLQNKSFNVVLENISFFFFVINTKHRNQLLGRNVVFNFKRGVT